MKQHGSLEVRIDQTNSWCEATLIPSETHELLLENLTPRAFPIRVPVLETKCVGFQFPQSGSWSSLKETPKSTNASMADAKHQGIPKGTSSGLPEKAKTLRRHRIKPPNEVVKLQDR